MVFTRCFWNPVGAISRFPLSHLWKDNCRKYCNHFTLMGHTETSLEALSDTHSTSQYQTQHGVHLPESTYNQNKKGKLGFGSKGIKITCLLDGQLKVFKITVCTDYQRNNTNRYSEFSLITFNVLSIKSWDSETKQGIQNRKSKSVCTLLKSK